MKVLKKRLALPVAFVLAWLLGVGTVYALTSANFASRAQSWAAESCTQKLLNKKRTAENDMKAAECFNYYNNIKNSERITSQDQSISALASSKAPTLLDGDNTVLGPLVTHANTDIFGSLAFYSKSLNLLIPIDSQGNIARGNYIIAYSNAGCTGSPYLIQGQAEGTLSIFDGITLARLSGQYFAPSGPIASHTYLSQSQGGIACEPYPSTTPRQGISVTPLASIPYSNPLPLPIHL